MATHLRVVAGNFEDERDEAVRRIKELESGIEDLYDNGIGLAGRIAVLGQERDQARTIARQLLALVRKLRGDLDSTRGELRALESMIDPQNR